MRWDALKNRPLGFHATIDGSSSNDPLSGSIAPPAAGTVAMTVFV